MHYVPTYQPTYLSDSNECDDSSDSRDSSEYLQKSCNLSTKKNTEPSISFSSSSF